MEVDDFCAAGGLQKAGLWGCGLWGKIVGQKCGIYGVEVTGEIRDRLRIVLLRRIGEGGMGTVYEGEQLGAEGFRKSVAVKVIRPELTASEEFVRMFIGEAKLVADLVHENIVQMYQLGRAETTYYMTMELIRGVSLSEFLWRHRERGLPVPEALVAFIASRVCRALEYAHTRCDSNGNPLGIVHRDVSPGNILMTWEGVVKLGDFGIAKARHLMVYKEEERLFGKLGYMSPEQARFEETDARSDLYSLGVVMWEMLTGRRLVEPGPTRLVLERIKEQEAEDVRSFRRGLDERLAQIVEKALAKERSMRYQSAGEMGYALEYLMYQDRYGPTNLTLSCYLARLFEERAPASPDGLEQEIKRMPEIFGGL